MSLSCSANCAAVDSATLSILLLATICFACNSAVAVDKRTSRSATCELRLCVANAFTISHTKSPTKTIVLYDFSIPNTQNNKSSITIKYIHITDKLKNKQVKYDKMILQIDIY